jgi:hypothetical protein
VNAAALAIGALDLVRRLPKFNQNGTVSFRSKIRAAMMVERDSRETGHQTLSQEPQSESAPVRSKRKAHRPTADEAVGLRAPARREQPFEADEDRERQEPTVGDETRKGWLRRHPIAVALGLLLIAIALPVGYLYWDYTSHFESTDDAYIASRQFAISRRFPATSRQCRSPTMSMPTLAR